LLKIEHSAVESRNSFQPDVPAPFPPTDFQFRDLLLNLSASCRFKHFKFNLAAQT
jgi:hypothetical protein